MLPIPTAQMSWQNGFPKFTALLIFDQHFVMLHAFLPESRDSSCPLLCHFPDNAGTPLPELPRLQSQAFTTNSAMVCCLRYSQMDCPGVLPFT